MQPDRENSLSDEATFAGRPRPQRSDVSLGDERTLGDGLSGQDTIIDDIEVVDLDARYRIEGELGQGGMGAVMLATDTRLDRKVAIKRILGEAAGNRLAVNRFLTEAKSIAALNHANIVQIYDYGRATDGPFLIMEFVDGGSLLDRCRDGAMPLEAAVDMACQLCDGLAKAHDLGIIHRDIKPANVLLTKDGIPKLTDFGLAKAQAGDHGQTMTGAVLGTPDFMPPEQRRDASLVDHRSDLWSLAATAYQMLTGRSPKIIRLHEVPQVLQAVLAKALEDEKEDRYQSAGELRQAIRSATDKPAARPAAVTTDLATGECPKCHEPNEASRKFCRNADCAAALRVKCLAQTCGHEIPVWEKVCPECGAKQPDLVAEKAAQLSAERDSAEHHLASYDFSSATRIAEALQGITDSRFDAFRTWGQAFGEQIVHEKSAADALVSTRVGDATAHRTAYDYGSAIHAIESLPEPLRTGSPADLLGSLRADWEESKQLLETIRQRIVARDLDGLLKPAKRALALRGDREDLRKLVSQLEERKEKRKRQAEEAFEAATKLFAETSDAKNAFDKLRPYWPLSNPQHSAFADILRKAVAEEDTLTQMLTAAKADGVISSDEVVALANQVTKCLSYNPEHPRILALREQLLARMLKEPRHYRRHMPALESFLCSLGSRVPEPLRRLQAEVENERTRIEAEAQRAKAQAEQLARRAAHEISGGQRGFLLERVKEMAKSTFGSDELKCPVCGVGVKAKRLVNHYEKKHVSR